MKKTRKIIQIAAVPKTKYSLAHIVAVCDDSTVWVMWDDDTVEWVLFPKIPQMEIDNEA